MSTLSTPRSDTKMIPVARPYVGAEEEQAVVAVLRSGWLSPRTACRRIRKKFSEYIGCDHAVAVSSCTTALHLALVAIGIGVGDEVICPSLSFIATANSIAYTGATAVFGDIDPDTYNLDPARLEELITPRTKAILVVHQIGLPAEMNSLLAVAAKHDLAIIEDAALRYRFGIRRQAHWQAMLGKAGMLQLPPQKGSHHWRRRHDHYKRCRVG